MVETISLGALNRYIHNFFWWLLTLALLSHANWAQVVIVAICLIQLLLFVLYVLKGPDWIGRDLIDPKATDDTGKRAVRTRGRPRRNEDHQT